jgi:hypothetical protein
MRSTDGWAHVRLGAVMPVRTGDSAFFALRDVRRRRKRAFGRRAIDDGGGSCRRQAVESDRFDALVRTLARPASRRSFAALAAVAFAPLAAAAKSSGGPEPAACLAVGKRCSQPTSPGAAHVKARRKGKHHPPACTKCCSRFGAAGPDGKARCTCKGEGVSCDNDSQCCAGQCRNNACTGCPGNTVFCPDGCADLQTNNQHCGSCDVACASGQRCVNGACGCDQQSCPTGCCDGTSCNRGTSEQACGTNGAACQICDGNQRCDGQSCVCVPTTCAKAGKNCGQIADGCGGILNCGTCTAPQSCGGGGTANICGCTPATTCPAGQNCGTITDGCGGTLDCGSCDANQCLTCASNVCVSTCGGATPVCNGSGGCVCNATSCPSDQTCQGGQCVSVCAGADFCISGRASCGNSRDRTCAVT